MYTIPIVILIIGLLLLGVNIYLLFSDYKYVLQSKVKHYLIVNILSIVLAVSIIICASVYFFMIYSQLQ
ncbi:hypothetical protein UA3_02496 [Enterococcus faecium EnGen0263]|nr:hypothetical protein UA3_02496 [Enterococcus faecium EnGen0263]OTO22126.1 hypothetical protein A5816_002798 [Enterococcus sp. 3G1_DIV0629]